MATPSITDRLLADLALGMAADWRPLSARIERAARSKAPAMEIERLTRAVAASRERAGMRATRIPRIAYPPELPVAARRDEIAAAIAAHPVVIVCGETGSGKTTQLPKICLEVGRGVRGLIGHTQPRRIAARSVATRIAQELGTPVGEAVGYKVRFTDHTRPDAFIKLMTDGILLAETQSDRQLAAYDTIIVDEAHERSLNIDFLLGYLKRLTRERPDLKVIVTSATLDAARFARHFGEGDRPAPVIEVSGRAYPVDVRYRPLVKDEDDDEEELEEAIVAAVEDLWRAGPGDILVFLPGEREIRETSELLLRGLARRPYASAAGGAAALRATVGRAAAARVRAQRWAPHRTGDQRGRDFAHRSRHPQRRRCRVWRGSSATRCATRSRSCRSRKSRSPRRTSAPVAAGASLQAFACACTAEDDFAARPEYTEPEILRSSLAAVILRMAALDLGAVDAFPFVEPPSPRAIADGYQLLQELGAVDGQRRLTPLGRELARLPVDPRIGRMILAAKDAGCLAEMLVIASALAVPDPRDRPLDKQQAADQAHLRFRDERSDFLSLLALWQFFADALSARLSHRALVDRCRAHFVSYLRLREWRDLHQQLSEQVRELGWRWTEALPDKVDDARYVAIHKALLAGLLSNIGCKSDEGEPYLGTRGIRFYLHPGSGLAKKSAKWVLAAELTETTRLYARSVAKVEPEWIEGAAGNLVERSYFDPHWDKTRGEVIGAERVALYGLTLVARRRVAYGRVDPVAAREVFLRDALAADELESNASFLAHNRNLIAEVAELEHKARRQDVLVDDEAIVAFYGERIPAGIHSAAGFERWRVAAEAREPKLLYVTREALMRHAAAGITAAQYPEFVEMAGARLLLKYRFSPGHPLDGLTLTVPLSLLNQIDGARLSWLVPGMVREKLTWYLKALPKAWRNRLTPVPEVVTAFLEAAGPDAEAQNRHMEEALRSFCANRLADTIPADVWRATPVPEHLLVNVRVVDASGAELGQGRDLARLRTQLGEAAQLSFAAVGPALERTGITRWDFGDLPPSLAFVRDGRSVTGYPALVDEGDSVALKLFDTQHSAESATRAAIVRLIRMELKDAVRRWDKEPSGFVATALQLRPVMPADALFADVIRATCVRAFLGDDPLPRSESAFAEQVKRARARLPAVAEGAIRLLGAIAIEYHALTQKIAALPPARSRFGAELAAQRDALVYAGFFSATPWAQLNHLPRYLQALQRRLVKAAENPAQDTKHAQAVAALWERYRSRADANRAAQRVEPALDAYRWLLEELKVSLFAQELRTAQPVSYKRVERAWAELSRG